MDGNNIVGMRLALYAFDAGGHLAIDDNRGRSLGVDDIHHGAVQGFNVLTLRTNDI
jgi:hypothetical protein